MRQRTLNIANSVGGVEVVVATVLIDSFAEMLKAETELLCPKCGQKTKHQQSWNCSGCGSSYGSWTKLRKVLSGSGETVVKEQFTGNGEVVTAKAYVMDMDEFTKYVDATSSEYGVIAKDTRSAENLRKLLIATKNLNKVIVICFKDTYEERVAVLTISISGRVILKELIPQNLANVTETMSVNLKEVNPQEVTEAEAYVKTLPVAKEENLNVTDYRTKGISKEKISPKVVELEAVIAKVKKQTTTS